MWWILPTSDSVLQNRHILDNESYFEKMMRRNVTQQFSKAQQLKLDADGRRYTNQLLVKEYLDEFSGVTPW